MSVGKSGGRGTRREGEACLSGNNSDRLLSQQNTQDFLLAVIPAEPPEASARASRLRSALMGATMLAGAASLVVLPPQQAQAQLPNPVDSNITVSGTTESLPGNLIIGVTGNGSVRVENGGVVTNGLDGIIGQVPTRTGTVVVTGLDSRWIVGNNLIVGNDGTGTLTLSHGGEVVAVGAFIANQASGTGTLNFGAAAGDAAVAAGTLDTPNIAFGPGTGTIVFNHTSNDFELGSNIFGNGTVRLLAGHTILSGNNSYTGNTLLEGGTLTLGSNNALGGSTLRTTGSVVDYADGVNIANPVIIDSNTTQFQVLSGSATQSGVISENNGPRPFEKIGGGELILTAANTWTSDTTVTDGTLTFDGGSVALAANMYLYVGRENDDDAALNIVNGGSVSSQFTYIGEVASAVGTVTVSGAGSLMTNSAETTVGRSGTGTLNIENGGEVSSTRSWIGRFAGSNGFATVTGTDSLWTHSTYLVVGTAGDGDLTISDGGRVEVADQGIWIAEMADSVGAITVTGAGSSLVNTGTSLRVGNAGTGTLTIESGASVSNTLGILGNSAGSTGTATVTGTGSSWTNSNHLDVGLEGIGSLLIADGGSVSNSWGTAGSQAGAQGNVTVTGAGSTWTSSLGAIIGFSGSGALTVANGGAVLSDHGQIGENASSIGEVTVTGAGSQWINNNFLYVGNSGTGSLTISDGGRVSAPSQLVFASLATSTGTLNIGAGAGDAAVAAGTLDSDTLEFGLGLGRLVFNHTGGGAGYSFASNISGGGAARSLIRQLAGFTRLTGDNSGYLGAFSVEGGTLSVDSALGGAGGTVMSGGTLTGAGSIAGLVTVNSGGILAGMSGTTLTMDELVLEDGAIINVALGAAGGSELFNVTGDLTLDGILNVTDAGGFGPGLYSLFTYGGSLTDNGLALGSAPVADLLPGELTIQTSITGQVNLVSNVGVDLLFWDGDAPGNALNGVIDGGDGIWSASSFTFTDIGGRVSGPSRPTPSFVIFSAAPGNVTVDDSAGAVEIAGAQFAVDGYVIDGDAITLAGNGAGEAIFRVGDGTIAGAGYTATIGSALSGDVTLVKTDLGTLTLTGANSYTGGTEVRGGTLIGSTRSIIGDIANDGVVVFDQADDATLDQALSGDGLFRFTGGAEFTLGSGNSYAGGTQVFGSQLVLTADDSAGTGAITLNNSNIAYEDGITVSNTLTFSGTNELQVRSGTATHAGLVTGGGDLGLTGAGTLIFTGNGSAFTGNTIITGNVLMNGVLGGTIEVADGGVLRGFGTLGSTRLLSGSTIAPGNSVGTLTIDGDLVFETGSVYALTVLDDGSMDLITVNGAATIGSGAVLSPTSLAGLAFGTRNVILSASNGVTGAFQLDEAVSNLPFVSSGLETSANEVVVFFDRNGTAFETLAPSGNAASAARAADTLGSGNPLWDALVWLDAASAPAAFEMLQGDVHATHRQLVLDDSVHTRRAVTSRLAAARSEEAGSAWISGHFGGAQMDARTGVPRVSSDSSGIILGLDTAVHENGRIGVVAAFGETSFTLTGRNTSGSTESRSLGVYGGLQAGALGVSAGAIYGWHDLATSRTVSFAGFNEQLRSGHDGDSVQVFGEASLAGPAGLEPFVSLAHIRLDTGGFAEAGGAAALTIDSETRQMTQGTLGTRLGHDWQAGGTAIRLEGSLGWRRVFSGERQSVSGNLSGAPVFFEGNGVDRDAAAIEAGVTIEPMSRMSLELGYAGEIGSNARNHRAEFRLRMTF